MSKINCKICFQDNKQYITCTVCDNHLCINCLSSMLLYTCGNKHGHDDWSMKDITYGVKCPYDRSLLGIKKNLVKIILGHNSKDVHIIGPVCSCKNCPDLKIEHLPCKHGCVSCFGSILKTEFI